MFFSLLKPEISLNPKNTNFKMATISYSFASKFSEIPY
ncbi:hypothetical protein NU09_3427 [Flavobacterium beibuense]|uniref:Uncharacterized protein n=1 Tax=Flavobacterium beibuense TaxID=657326 RepID=A0A444W3E6_9FLAO|nr:hypothetical protein NU09_3427 [Flavobacterium beibuense]